MATEQTSTATYSSAKQSLPTVSEIIDHHETHTKADHPPGMMHYAQTTPPQDEAAQSTAPRTFLVRHYSQPASKPNATPNEGEENEAGQWHRLYGKPEEIRRSISGIRKLSDTDVAKIAKTVESKRRSG